MVKAAEEAWCKDCTPEAEARLLDLKRQISQVGALEHIENTSHTQTEPPGATVKRAG